ncbi:hypothetical protein K438DRAFT_1944363 [Mycena galopus ATCC 62051]|nr:hypothetical protein K438DRAFT_1944363 [Mycena galopus ATCC 62051]
MPFWQEIKALESKLSTVVFRMVTRHAAGGLREFSSTHDETYDREEPRGQDWTSSGGPGSLEAQIQSLEHGAWREKSRTDGTGTAECSRGVGRPEEREGVTRRARRFRKSQRTEHQSGSENTDRTQCHIRGTGRTQVLGVRAIWIWKSKVERSEGRNVWKGRRNIQRGRISEREGVQKVGCQGKDI